jgi:translocation and assembly module TamA
LRFVALAAGLSLVLSTSTGITAQEVRLQATGADQALIDVLSNASLLLTLSADRATDAQDYVAAARADYRRLLTGLYAEGYYGGSISILIDGREASAIAPLDAPQRIGTVVIDVIPGPRFTFGRTTVAPLAPGTELPGNFATGEIARAETIRDAVRAGVAGWRDEGHAKAAPDGQRITADHPSDRLDVAITLAPGPQLTFGPLAVTGNVRVRADRIVDIAGLPSGEVYSPDDLDRAAARLRRTGAFRSVALVEADDIGPGNTLPVEAQVIEAKPRRLGFGVELSSTDGLALTSYWLHRNFLGGAERFRVDGGVKGIGGTTGGLDYTLGVSFNRPRTFSVDTDLFADALIEQLDEPEYLIRQVKAEVGLTRLIGDDLTLSGAVGVTSAHVEDDLGTRDYTLLSLPITGTRDRRDNPLNAKSGYYLDLEITPFLGFGDAGDGARVYADARYFRSFGENDRFTLALRGQLGSVFGVEAALAPTDFLFFSGGGGTVRGQSYQSLGVDLGGGLTIGGRSFFGTSLEARYDITEKIGAVVFYDVGFVGADELPFENGAWQMGAGVGARYNTGIGPIRLDVALPVDGDSNTVQFYVGIGQSF